MFRCVSLKLVPYADALDAAGGAGGANPYGIRTISEHISDSVIKRHIKMLEATAGAGLRHLLLLYYIYQRERER